MSRYPILLPDTFYHVYNRGNNGEPLFREARNYEHFLKLYEQHADPLLELHAYSLMGNHFHLLIRVRAQAVLEAACRRADDGLRRLFLAYAMGFNRAYDRSGSLFEKPFHRKPLRNERQVLAVARYIHRNPIHHGFCDDLLSWPWTSYALYQSDAPHWVRRDYVLAAAGGREGFEALHHAVAEDREMPSL